MTSAASKERKEAAAGARFDAVLAIFKNAWAEEYPSEPFEVDGVVTPRAMQFIKGYQDGLKARAIDRNAYQRGYMRTFLPKWRAWRMSDAIIDAALKDAPQ